ncbi:MAG: family 20 glycosylhydrolase [Rikenellaceae bacterium]
MRRLLFTIVGLFIGVSAVNAQIDNLLPKPQSVVEGRSTIDVTELKIVTDDKFATLAERSLAADIEFSDSARRTLEIVEVEQIAEARVNQDEAYRISVTKGGVRIEAQAQKGVYWALQTLRQLVVTKGGRTKIQECEIVDWPAFRVRGLMQDVGRSYISMDELKREIAKLSEYKINVFHWHLTENQSWRMESKIFPMLNDSINTTRMPGKFYTIEEAKELVEFCKDHNVLLIPEFDMPGHSAAFERTFRHDMQSAEGMKILKLLMEEVCETFDVPYIHIGTDEVAFKNRAFVPEMVAYVRSFGKKVISWSPGWKYSVGEIDMTHLWSYKGVAQAGIPAIDSKFHYLNHFDNFADIVALYRSRVYNVDEGSDDIAGSVMAIWHDRLIEPEEDIIAQNAIYPNMLAFAERTWMGGGSEYFNDKGTLLDTTRTEDFIAFEDFERRMLYHKQRNFQGYPFFYVKQTNVEWSITDAFPNDGELTASFPPEQAIADSYTFNGEEYGVRKAIGNAIYLRHVWGTFLPSFYEDPQPNHTAYAYTWVYSPKDQECGMWISFQNYSRSEKDLAPPQGKWDYRESQIWINDQEVLPPTWSATHTEKSNEIPLGNENFEVRTPTKVQLNKGWNKIFLKLPVGEFQHPNTRLVKWMFIAALVTPDGTDSVEGLIYSSTAPKTK